MQSQNYGAPAAPTEKCSCVTDVKRRVPSQSGTQFPARIPYLVQVKNLATGDQVTRKICALLDGHA